MPKKSSNIYSTTSVDDEIDNHLMREANDFTDMDSDSDLDEFLELESKDQYSTDYVDEELDIFFENEAMAIVFTLGSTPNTFITKKKTVMIFFHISII